MLTRYVDSQGNVHDAIDDRAAFKNWKEDKFVEVLSYEIVPALLNSNAVAPMQPVAAQTRRSRGRSSPYGLGPPLSAGVMRQMKTGRMLYEQMQLR
ncbi:MAG: hypothetical protein ACREYE_10780 [Gammaproteobacteria bacterium]